jgi:hypothetical protein
MTLRSPLGERLRRRHRPSWMGPKRILSHRWGSWGLRRRVAARVAPSRRPANQQTLWGPKLEMSLLWGLKSASFPKSDFKTWELYALMMIARTVRCLMLYLVPPMTLGARPVLNALRT